MSAEWVNGELRGAKGMFPADFVDSVPDDLPLEAKKEEKETSKAEPKPEVGSCVHAHVYVCMCVHLHGLCLL